MTRPIILTDADAWAVALAYLQDSEYVTIWALVRIDRDDESGAVTHVIAQDCGHASNVLIVELDGARVICAG